MTSIFENNAVEIGCLLIVLLISILISLTRTASSLRDRLFKLNLFCYANSCIISILYNGLLPLFKQGRLSEVYIYIAHNSFYIDLLIMFILYITYISDLFNISKEKAKIINVIKWCILIVSSVIILTSNFTHLGFYIIDGEINRNVYLNGVSIGYALDMLVILYIVVKYRKTMVTEIFRILLSIILISVIIMVVQEIYLDGKFTVLTFLFPIIAIFYCLHSIAYDLNTGTVGIEFLANLIENERSYGFVYLYLSDFRVEKMTDDFKHILLHFNRNFFKKYKIYKFGENNFILVYNSRREKADFAELEKGFNNIYERYEMNYKVLVDDDCHLDTIDKLRAYCDYTTGNMQENSFVYAGEAIKKDFIRKQIILEQLNDIRNKADLNDERVLVFCQPVLNKKTGRFTTGEALMRLKLPELGMIFPDEFIPLAEQNDLLHPLSNVILNKTCIAIRKFMDEGYEVERISVNYSINEFNKHGFKSEFLEIIEKNNIPMEKIAIELTESQDSYDFEKVHENMNVLSNYNIKFYLDDYGTGYSNFERLIKLPFDIVKFDKSLLVSMKKSDSSKYMVTNMSKLFKDIGYNILFEGVEDNDDEVVCSNLGFDYLQGYKYSKPVAIEEIVHFLEKK